eukprot:gene26462-biopygen16561
MNSCHRNRVGIEAADPDPGQEIQKGPRSTSTNVTVL